MQISLSYCHISGLHLSRGVYVSPEKHKTQEWAEGEMPNAESDTGWEVLFWFFKRKRQQVWDWGSFIYWFNSYLKSTSSVLGGVPCLLLWLQTWKGRNELLSQICCCNHSWSDFPAFCKWFLEFISSVYICVVS